MWPHYSTSYNQSQRIPVPWAVNCQTTTATTRVTTNREWCETSESGSRYNRQLRLWRISAWFIRSVLFIVCFGCHPNQWSSSSIGRVIQPLLMSRQVCVCIEFGFRRHNYPLMIAGCNLISVFQSLQPIMLSTIIIVLLVGYQSKDPSLV